MAVVYELIENKLQKIYVGLTELPLEQEFARVKNAPTAVFNGWQWDSVLVRSVETFDKKELAKAFYDRYARKTPPPGWTVLTS